MVAQKPRPRIKLTYEDYLTTPEDKRYQLLDGELIMAPAPNEPHQRVQAELGTALFMFVKQNELGRVYFAPTDVVLSDTDVVQPDLLFISNERRRIITHANIQGAPDLVVEILSPSTSQYDNGYKRSLYEQHGVKEYWMMGTDPIAVTVLLLGADGFEVIATYGEGDTLTSPTLEGFSIKVDDIFAG